MLHIERKDVDPEIAVLFVQGRIALGRESQRLEALVKELQDSNVKKVVIDLSGVDYVDSSGLGILTFCFASMKNSGGAMRIAGAAGRVLELIQFTRMDSILPVFATLDDATRDFS